MKSNIALITALISALAAGATAPSNQYIVASSYSASGCDGESDQAVEIETGKCYHAWEECLNNPVLKPGCDFLAMQPYGTDLSFIASCTNGNISVVAYNGKGCDNPSTAIQNGAQIGIPVDTCVVNYKFKCSDYTSTETENTEHKITKHNGTETKPKMAPSATYSASAGFYVIPEMAIGLLGVLFF